MGIRVVEWGTLISAPYAGKLLADLGAEVVKVEPPGIGDPARHHGPFPKDIPHPERSGLFLNLNTNKLSVTLAPQLPSGRRILARLLEQADVFLTNMPLVTLDALALDYKAVAVVNPRLVMTAVTPYGLTGPYRDYKGYDISVCALGGVSYSVGEPGRPPLAPPFSQSDYQAALGATAATLTALLAREKTGHGQLVDIASYEIWATIHSGSAYTTYIYLGTTGHRAGRRRRDLYPYTLLRCKDGYMCLIAREGRQWKRFLVDVVGRADLADDPRYRDRRALGEQRPEEMDMLLAPWLEAHTRDEIFALCRQHRVPFAPVLTVNELFLNAHLRERQFFVQADRPEVGTLTYPGAPYKFSDTPWRIQRPAPLLGQHNGEVYCKGLGYSRNDLVRFRNAGVI